MADDQKQTFPTRNIRTLLREISTGIDIDLQNLRAGTRYEHVRNSDVKVFVCALQSEATVSRIARELNITRQAVHGSVYRLMELKVLELKPLANNSRDKLVVVTERGRHAQETAQQHINVIENKMVAKIGKKKLEELRSTLDDLADIFRQRA